MITRSRAAMRQLDGRTIGATRRTITKAPSGAVLQPGRMDTYNSHPATGLTLEMLLSYYRQAERGCPVRQFDCFDDLIEVDGHLRGLINTRIESISGSDWSLKPGRADAPSIKAAEALEDYIRNSLALVDPSDGCSSDFREFIEHQLTAPHYGIACTNIVWDYADGIIAPAEFLNAPPRRFASPSIERANEIYLIGPDGTSSDLVELDPGLWAITRYRFRNPWASGLMRTAGFWAMTKRWGVRDWQVFGEMFGLPNVVGFYEEGAGLESRKALEEAVQQIGTDGWAILADTTNITIKDSARSGDPGSVYPGQIQLAEAQMSKLIAGSTTASDTGGDVGSYGLGVVHEARAYALARSDARRVESTFTRDIGAWFCRYNGFDRAAPPRLKIQIARDNLERAKVLQIVGQVIGLDPTQIQEEFSLRAPADGKGVKFAPTLVPNP